MKIRLGAVNLPMRTGSNRETIKRFLYIGRGVPAAPWVWMLRPSKASQRDLADGRATLDSSMSSGQVLRGDRTQHLCCGGSEQARVNHRGNLFEKTVLLNHVDSLEQ